MLISNKNALFHLITSPPNSATKGACGNGWVCEHRWSTVADMIQFSNAVAGEPLTNWQVLFDIQINYLDCKLKYCTIFNDSTILTLLLYSRKMDQ